MEIKNFDNKKEDIIACSYLCPYSFLDTILSNYISPDKTINIYIDSKNAFPTIHNPSEAMKLINYYNSNSDKYVIARSMILLANHWMGYFKKRNMKVNIFFFDERGSSTYHDSYSKDYKKERKLSKTRIATELFEDEKLFDNFSHIWDKNINLVSNLFKILNGLYYIKLKNLEADFIPKFIMKEYFYNKENELDTKYIHLILGNDKDHLQSLKKYNVLQLSRQIKTKTWKLYTENNVMEKLLGNDFNYNNEINYNKFIPHILSIVGDKVDGVNGISGFGYKTAYSLLTSLIENNILTYDDINIDNFINKLKVYNKIYTKGSLSSKIKSILINEDLLRKNFKLTDYDSIIEWLPYDKKQEIRKQLNKEDSSNDIRRSYLLQLCLYEKSFRNIL